MTDDNRAAQEALSKRLLDFAIKKHENHIIKFAVDESINKFLNDKIDLAKLIGIDVLLIQDVIFLEDDTLIISEVDRKKFREYYKYDQDMLMESFNRRF